MLLEPAAARRSAERASLQQVAGLRRMLEEMAELEGGSGRYSTRPRARREWRKGLTGGLGRGMLAQSDRIGSTLSASDARRSECPERCS
ncbi:hypothetical protein [Actinacidiphila glaucinigra]|uniref:hypothetical protein n=1 Tax=Actinacidiphila glaucinigra TaxID=235986 RepID=UPI00396A29C1